VPNSKPILGFGPIGWIAAVILAGIIGLALRRYDFQYHFIFLIHDWLGVDAVYVLGHQSEAESQTGRRLPTLRL